MVSSGRGASASGRPALRFEVLGPLRVFRGDVALPLGPVQRRVVLAVLLLQRNRSIGRQQVIDAVWGKSQPSHAVNLVQRHVSGLRMMLEPNRSARSSSDLLSWTDTGYLFKAPAGSLDLDVFESRLAAARAARAVGELAKAAEELHAALQLWRGPVCDGLSSPLLDAQRERLTERHIGALEERIDLDLNLGNHQEVIAELRHLIAEHPLRERLRGLLMSALYRSGRQADALAAYQDARKHLREELGVEPAVALQRLQQQILAADPVLDPARTDPSDALEIEVPVPAPSVRVPAQLPHGLAGFVGRDDELAQLTALLPSSDAAPATVVITAIAGMAGVGKTALAVHWGHQVSQRFPDGQLYVNLRGFDPAGTPMGPAEAIGHLLAALGVPAEQLPDGLAEQAALYRSRIANRRVLIVLDNARDAEQVRPLLPGSAGCMVLITSRNDLTSLAAVDGAFTLTVDLLSPTEARGLLARRLGERRVEQEPEAVETIIACCDRLPLALSIVAARAMRTPRYPLARLAAQLRQAPGALDTLDGGDHAANVRAVFSWSYEQLSESAGRLFRVLGLHAGPDISLTTLAGMSGMPDDQQEAALLELLRANLITEPAPGRFVLHDLLRAFAGELAARHDSPDDRVAAIRRMLDHYLQTALRADQLLETNRADAGRLLTFAVNAANPDSEPLADLPEALDWFNAEWQALSAALRLAARLGFDDHAWRLARSLASFLDRRGHWRESADLQRIALAAAVRIGDPSAQAVSHSSLADVCIWLGEYSDAQHHLLRCLQLYRQVGDRAGQAEVERSITRLLGRQGKYGEALPHARQASDLFSELGQRAGEARAINAMGWYNIQLGRLSEGLRLCQQSLNLQRLINDRFGQADTLDSLGHAYFQLSEFEQAANCYQQAIELYQEFGDRHHEASVRVALGDSYQAEGQTGAARDCWLAALRTLDELGHPSAAGVRAKLTGRLEPPAG